MAEKNQKTFHAPMDPTKLLALYTKKQKLCQAFAADAGNPIPIGVTCAVAMRVMWDE